MKKDIHLRFFNSATHDLPLNRGYFQKSLNEKTISAYHKTLTESPVEKLETRVIGGHIT